MDLATVHTLYDVLQGDRFCFLYSGRFHDEHTASLITLGEESLNDARADRAYRQRLSYVMVEAYQNILRHRAALAPELESGAGRSLFMLRSHAAGDEIVAMDPVTEAEVPALKASLERIGGLDLRQLKELFLRSLQDGSRSERGGAGLGLIEMARRSGHRLRHALTPIDAAHRLFTLQIVVGGGDTQATAMEALPELHGYVAGADLLLLCKGASSAGVQEAVLRIIEKDLDDRPDRSEARARAYLAAVEWLQGFAAVDNGPIVALGRLNGQYALVLGVKLDPAAAERTQMEVEEINALEGAGLERYYRDVLLGRRQGAGPGFIGLLDLARRSTARLRVERITRPDGVLVVLEALI
ncbi:MAG: SiaB family protein kinase [Flavobacteriales bacterium]